MCGRRRRSEVGGCVSVCGSETFSVYSGKSLIDSNMLGPEGVQITKMFG